MIKLQFDFEEQSLYFTEPVQIISTHCIKQVKACFIAIEEALQSGFYVAGYLAYEAASAFNNELITQPSSMPLLWFGVFEQPHNTTKQNTTTLDYLPLWQANINSSHYQKDIQTIQHEIAQGNVYQVNHTLRFTAQIQTSHKALYQQLKNAQQSAYCAFLQTDEWDIISASPELFFKRNQHHILTKPMKGTRPRGKTKQQDIQLKEDLKNSSKDLAENTMIVDLLRNDLAKISHTGSVKVKNAFCIEAYPTVWQMTSTVIAQLQENIHYFDIFKALFPCGSITGAPKITAMQLIQQLEPLARGICYGALGYISPNQQAIFNVPIRTLHINNQTQTGTYCAGGGITWHSAWQQEYQEAYDKAQIILNPIQGLFETILLDDGVAFLLDKHLQRLQSSCHIFKIPFSQAHILADIQAFLQQHPEGQYKYRIEIHQNGQIKSDCQEIDIMYFSIQAQLNCLAIHSSNQLFYHKTIHRNIYPDATLENEFLLYNEKNELTEFVNGNAVFQIDQTWYTPPVSCGLLAGTYRAQLLEEQKITEKVITIADLPKVTAIAFINSVRKWIPVKLKNNR